MGIENTLRIPVNLEVIWKIDKKLGQPSELRIKNPCREMAFDISSGGMGIISKHFLPIGSRIEIAFSGRILGLKKHFRLKGEVRYCSPLKQTNFRCGIKFINPPQLYSAKFNEFKLASEKRHDPRVHLAD
ncbi:MAG: PilZ domain-containing protein [Candidatus Omnitrophota bacterium]